MFHVQHSSISLKHVSKLTGSQGVGQIKPDWAMEESFEFDLRQSSLKVGEEQTRHQMRILTCIQFMQQVDALAASHPVSVTVNDPKEINSLFDHAISYSKV